jgi:hypothetical protein
MRFAFDSGKNTTPPAKPAFLNKPVQLDVQVGRDTLQRIPSGDT